MGVVPLLIATFPCSVTATTRTVSSSPPSDQKEEKHMKLRMHMLVAAGLVGLLFAPTPEAWAKAGAGGFNPDCTTAKHARNALKATGTMAVEVSGYIFDENQSQTVDYTLRMERRNKKRFFRYTTTFPIIGDSPEDVACRALDALTDQILDPLQELFTAQEVIHRSLMHLCIITDDAFRDAEPTDADQVIPGSNTGTNPGDTGRAATLADIVVYAQEATCQ
jgi:hypothetical protein